MQRSPTLLASVTATLSLTAPAPAGFIYERQTFDSPTAAAAAGWAGLGNGANGNDFGFRTSDETGGASPGGEAGGAVARTEALAYYADVTLRDSLGLGNAISAWGEFDITTFAFNNAIRIGHFDATDASGPFEILGFQVAEPVPSTSSELLIFADIYLSDGTLAGAEDPFRISAHGDYTWRYDWDPLAGTLTVRFFDAAGSVGTSTLTVSQGERAVGVSLNAFGIATGGIGSVSAQNVVNVFIDDVTYTTATPGPPGWALALSGGVARVAGRWARRILRQAQARPSEA